MKSKIKKIILSAIGVLIMVAVVALYIHDVVILKLPFTNNLFRAIFVLIILTRALYRINFGKNRRPLAFYEKAYENEIRNAFEDKPVLRKKLLCACRLYDESNYRKSIKYLDELLEKSEQQRDGIPVLLFRALCYMDTGLYGEAIKVYYNILHYEPRNAQVHSNIGNCFIYIGDFEMALQHYDKAIECNPYSYHAYVNRANYYFRQQDNDKAIEDAVKSLEIKNNGHEAAALLAIIYSLKNDKVNEDKYYHLAVTSGRNPEELKQAIEFYKKESKKEKDIRE